MLKHRLEDYGVLLLRVALGTMFIAHSLIYMLMTLTLPETAEFFVFIGYPRGSLMQHLWLKPSVAFSLF